jgi:hypothetical protein
MEMRDLIAKKIAKIHITFNNREEREEILFTVSQEYRQTYLSNNDEELRLQSFEETTNTVEDNGQLQE